MLVQPRDGIHPRLSLRSLQSLTQDYFGEGPRITWMKGVPQKLWPIEIFERLAEPITARDDERAALTARILEYYRQTDKAFRQQMKGKKWQYLDIITMSALLELVRTGKLSPDSSMKYLGVKDLSRDMVEHLLTTVVGRLHLYEENYHLALLDDVSDPTDGVVKLLGQHLTERFWTVKTGADGQLNLLVTEWLVDWQGQRWEVRRHVDNAAIGNAFMGISGNVWRKMPAKKLVTELDEVTKRIKAQLEILH
jgi:hypothetical protein